MNKSLLCCLFLVCCHPVFVWAQDAGFHPVVDKGPVVQAISKQSSSTNSLQCTFVQEKHLEMLEEVLISQGQFLFKKENSVRWQYLDPIRYTILIHNGKFTIDNDGKVTEFNTDSNPMFREINKMIITAIRGDFIGNTDFAPAYFESSGQYMSRLIPSSDQVRTMIESIDIYFDKSSMQVVKVVFSEPGGDMTSIKFADIIVNLEISDNQFTLK